MKTQARLNAQANNASAGTPEMSESKFPNAALPLSPHIQTNYSSMWKAVKKIAQPVGFKGLKRFYNIG